jgi:hypothetical protein
VVVFELKRNKMVNIGGNERTILAPAVTPRLNAGPPQNTFAILKKSVAKNRKI